MILFWIISCLWFCCPKFFFLLIRSKYCYSIHMGFFGLLHLNLYTVRTPNVICKLMLYLQHTFTLISSKHVHELIKYFAHSLAPSQCICLTLNFTLFVSYSYTLTLFFYLSVFHMATLLQTVLNVCVYCSISGLYTNSFFSLYF